VFKHAVDFARDPFEFVDRATSECGDIYRMDLPAVDDVFVLAHPDYFNRVLVADVDAFGKTEDYRRAFGNGLLSVEDQQWRRQREMMQPLFYREQIKGYTEQMVACTERRLEQWEAGDTRDMETEMRDLTLEILFATLFGRELVPGEDQELRDAADGLNEWFTPSSWILPTGFRHQLAVGSTTQRSGFDRKFGASLRRRAVSRSAHQSRTMELLEAVNRGLRSHPAIWTRPIYSHSYSESVTRMTVSSSRLTKSKISLSRWSLQATKRQLPHSRLRGTCWPRTRTSESGSMRN